MEIENAIELRREFGLWFKEMRTKAEKSQYRLAVECGWVSAQTISNIERGLMSLPPRRADRAAEALGVEIKIMREKIVKVHTALMFQRSA